MTRKLKRSINKTKWGGVIYKKNQNKSNKTPKKKSIISTGQLPNVVVKHPGSANTELFNNELLEQGVFKKETREEREERKERKKRIKLHKKREEQLRRAQSRSAHESFNMTGLQQALPDATPQPLSMSSLQKALPSF
jgi:hypothetical protein